MFTNASSFFLQPPARQLAERAGKIAQMNGAILSTQAAPRGEAINREIDLISVSEHSQLDSGRSLIGITWCTQCHGYAGTFPIALDTLASGALGDLTPLLSVKLPFAKAEEGFRWYRSERDEQDKPVIRVLINPAANSS